MNKTNQNLHDTKKVFMKKGTCSHALFYILNRESGNLKSDEERASDLLAGGMLRTGNQCGMLWGASLAAGTESYRRFNDHGQAIYAAITTTRHLVESYVRRTNSPNCREVTGCNVSSKLGMVKYFLFGKPIFCINLADKWAPEAVQSANEGLALKQNNLTHAPVSCAAETAKRMGANEEEMVMVSGFAGGLGLSGNACGALASALFINSLNWCRNHYEESGYNNPDNKKILKAFYNAADPDISCQKICGRKFETVEEHSEYFKNGGCSNIINLLTEVNP